MWKNNKTGEIKRLSFYKSKERCKNIINYANNNAKKLENCNIVHFMEEEISSDEFVEIIWEKIIEINDTEF